MIGGTENNKDSVYIIDFGLAKYYRGSDGEHIPYKDGKSLTGTARYASIHTHKGVEQSRRDDLESIGHVILYLLRGSLPWQGLPGKTKNEKYAAIKKKKIEISLDELCRGYSPEFKEYMEYCRALKFDSAPDYARCIAIFQRCMDRHKFDINIFDYTWKQNRLKREIDSLKSDIMGVIGKKKDEK